MIFKILISIPVIGFGFYLFLLATEHGNYSKPDISPEAKRYEDLTGIISFIAIFILLSNIWNGDKALYSSCKLDEDTYHSILISIEDLQYDFPEDAYFTVYGYFEDECYTFREAQKALSEILSYLDKNAALLNEIYSTLENNYIETEE